MTKKQYANKISEAMRTGAAIMPDGSQIVYNDGRWSRDRFFTVYDKNGECVDTAYSSINLYYLYR